MEVKQNGKLSVSNGDNNQLSQNIQRTINQVQQQSISSQSSQQTGRVGNDLELNVYDQELQACGGGYRSSAYMDDKCNEPSQGVHQICFIELGLRSQQFSLNTNQHSDWSSERGGNNHCLCLGAWALYCKKRNMGLVNEPASMQGVQQLKCDAIPKSVFSARYVNHWSYWNGHQLPNQIHDGVDALYQQCIQYAQGDQQKIQALTNNYHSFQSHYQQ